MNICEAQVFFANLILNGEQKKIAEKVMKNISTLKTNKNGK